MSTKIEWTNETWNPITGCSVVSPGCTNCYAMRQWSPYFQSKMRRVGKKAAGRELDRELHDAYPA